MKFKSLFAILACALLMCSCGGSKSKLAEIAEAIAQISENQEKYAEGYRALYELPRDKQEAELNALNEKQKAWCDENVSLAKKTEKLTSELQGTELACTAAENSGIIVKSATFTTASAPVKEQYNGMGGLVANFVVTVDYEGNLVGKPYLCLMAGDEVVYRALGTANEDNQMSFNFRINLKNAKSFVSVDGFRVETDGNAVAQQEASEEPEPEPVYEGDNGENSVQNAGNGLRVGANLSDALRSASHVTYEYNADSGIWATIGNVAIVIDEDQLNQKGIDFLSTIYSDIAPDIAFKPEYVKPDAKIKQIEKL